jgi:hypothetical protein
MQNAADPAIMFDGLHPTVATAQIMANAGEKFLRAGAQPNGPILTNPAPTLGGGSGGTQYSENPSLLVLPWVSPVLVPSTAGNYETLPADGTGSRARTLVEAGDYNNLISSAQSLVAVDGIERIGAMRWVISSLDDVVAGFPSYRTAKWGEFRTASFLHTSGIVDFLREGAPLQVNGGAAFNAAAENE